MAQNFPDYTETYVNDFADLLPGQASDELRARLRAFKRDHGVEFTVVTLRSMRDYGHDGAIEPFATGLFNAWGVGHTDRNDGVMLLVAQADRQVRIELGAGYDISLNRAMKRIIDDVMIPEFRDGNFIDGISMGVDAVAAELTLEPLSFGQRVMVWLNSAAQGLAALIQAALVPLAAALAGAAYWLWKRWQRRKPRICPIDRTTMVRLAEDTDDIFLVPGAQKEESLKSVDYDVWQCDRCRHRTIEAYPSLFSRYSACRSCNFRTLECDETILKTATTSSTGVKRLDYACLNCGDSYSLEKTIPKVSERSSSSGSSSFGGGRSSGGGASGSW
ncbi:MAG: TPM domain-containing protein [Pseudomonadota bacterium]